MLTHLHIENLAIIDRLDLDLGPGLISFTGETGAGKSILVDAIELLLGRRADPALLRNGAPLALVEGIFRLTGDVLPDVLRVLEREDLLDDRQTVTLARELRREGRSVARVNGRAVGAGLLRELGERLIDLHGQSAHLSLLRSGEHRDFLDRFGGAGKDLAEYQKGYVKHQAIRRDLAHLEAGEQDALQRSDLLGYQVREIEAAELEANEEAELTSQRRRLGNAERIHELASASLANLEEGSAESPAACDLIGRAVKNLEELQRLDPGRAELVEKGSMLLELVADLCRSLHQLDESFDADPARLEIVERRLELIRRLKRKYGDSIASVIAFGEAARCELSLIEHADERKAELQKAEESARQDLGEKGAALTRRRRRAGERLSKAVEKELAGLKMAVARFAVSLRQTPDPNGPLGEDGAPTAARADGLDEIEFLLAANPGEGVQSLARTASGGETARLMLALKTVLAGADSTPTLIFDEIDQGLGGGMGSIVGRKLRSLARHHQVFVVTHLPQVAAHAHQHFRVAKEVRGRRTHTQVARLADRERVHELASMLGAVSPANLQSAGDLLAAARGAS